MRIVIQRVSEASVEVDGNICGQIKKGFLLLVGIGKGDCEDDVITMAEKISKMRIFSDENDLKRFHYEFEVFQKYGVMHLQIQQQQQLHHGIILKVHGIECEIIW